MTETLPFLYFIPRNPRILILGSFPCFNGTDYGDWFYSGSGRNFFWPLLGEVYGMPVATRNEKQALCEQAGIALTDVALKVRRKKGDCSDANLDVIEYNYDSIAKCLAAGVEKVFFTSRFVERVFYRLFPDTTLPANLVPSPSPAANRHIGGLDEYRALLEAGKVSSVYEYRVMKYRTLLAGSAGSALANKSGRRKD